MRSVNAQITMQRWRFFYARMAIGSRLRRLVVHAPPRQLPDEAPTLAERAQRFRHLLDDLSAM
jgi:hypothetical protein